MLDIIRLILIHKIMGIAVFGLVSNIPQLRLLPMYTAPLEVTRYVVAPPPTTPPFLSMHTPYNCLKVMIESYTLNEKVRNPIPPPTSGGYSSDYMYQQSIMRLHDSINTVGEEDTEDILMPHCII